MNNPGAAPRRGTAGPATTHVVRATVSFAIGVLAQSVGAQSPVQLPRDSVNATWVAPTGKSLAVHAGGNLQAALDRAARGDEIVIDAGAVFTGTFTLPAKPGTAADGWIVVRTSAIDRLPPAHTRVGPKDAAAMPKLVTPNAMPALRTAPRASGWRLVGIEVTVNPTYGQVQSGLVLLGDGSNAQNSLDLIPTNLVLDRVYVHGTPDVQVKRCVALNSASTAIIDSDLAECHGKGFDSQAIGGWNGPGPYLIENNRLEAAGENVMFGGADPAIDSLIPSDIVLRGNYLVKQPGWKGRWTIKNLFELKNAQRVLAERNILRHNWVDAQPGFAVVFGSVNQEKRCPWCIVADVTFQYNHVDSTASGFNIFEGYPGSQLTRRIRIANDLITNVGLPQYGGAGRLFQILGRVADLAIENTTGFAPQMYVLFADQVPVPKDHIIFRNNIGGGAQYNFQSAVVNGPAMFARYCGRYFTFVGNVVAGQMLGGTPFGNASAQSIAAIRFVNAARGDFTLDPASPYRRSGAGGVRPGADMSVISALSGVVDR